MTAVVYSFFVQKGARWYGDAAVGGSAVGSAIADTKEPATDSKEPLRKRWKAIFPSQTRETQSTEVPHLSV